MKEFLATAVQRWTWSGITGSSWFPVNERRLWIRHRLRVPCAVKLVLSVWPAEQCRPRNTALWSAFDADSTTATPHLRRKKSWGSIRATTIRNFATLARRRESSGRNLCVTETGLPRFCATAAVLILEQPRDCFLRYSRRLDSTPRGLSTTARVPNGVLRTMGLRLGLAVWNGLVRNWIHST